MKNAITAAVYPENFSSDRLTCIGRPFHVRTDVHASTFLLSSSRHHSFIYIAGYSESLPSSKFKLDPPTTTVRAYFTRRILLDAFSNAKENREREREREKMGNSFTKGTQQTSILRKSQSCSSVKGKRRAHCLYFS